MRNRKWLLTPLACLALAPAGFAAPSYSYVAVPEAGSVTVGSNVYDLYLQETVPTGSTAVVPGDGGLYGAGVAVVEQAGGTGVSVSGATNNTASAANGANNTNFSAGGATNGGAYNFVATSTSAANVLEAVGTSPTGVFAVSSATAGGTTTNRYLLGTVTLSVASGANATFNVESLFDASADALKGAGTLGNTLTNTNFYDLDPNSTSPAYTGADANPTSFTVNTASPVPEPASLAVFGIGAAGLIVRRRRPVKE